MYKRILVSIDGSESSARGLEEAIGLSKEFGASLRLMHAVNEYFPAPGFGTGTHANELIESFREVGMALLDSAASKARERSVDVSTALLDGIGHRVSDLILDHAKEWSADLIVMGTHGRRGLSSLALGSDAEMVLRAATVPILFA